MGRGHEMGLLGSLLSPFPVVLLDGLAKTNNNKGRKGRKKKQEARLLCCLFGCLVVVLFLVLGKLTAMMASNVFGFKSKGSGWLG